MACAGFRQDYTRCGDRGRYYPTGISESIVIETAGYTMVALKIIERRRIERAKEIETPVPINTMPLPVLPLAEAAGWVGTYDRLWAVAPVP